MFCAISLDETESYESDVGYITSVIDLSGDSASHVAVFGDRRRTKTRLEFVREIRATPTPTMSQNTKTNLYSTPQDSSGSVHSLFQSY